MATIIYGPQIDDVDPSPGGGGPSPYRHVQGVASASWVINHNIGFHVNWRVINSAGDNVIGHVEDMGLNQTIISFFSDGNPIAFSGEAYGS